MLCPRCFSPRRGDYWTATLTNGLSACPASSGEVSGSVSEVFLLLIARAGQEEVIRPLITPCAGIGTTTSSKSCTNVCSCRLMALSDYCTAAEVSVCLSECCQHQQLLRFPLRISPETGISVSVACSTCGCLVRKRIAAPNYGFRGGSARRHVCLFAFSLTRPH